MKKYSILLIAFTLFILSSCKKEGCTDPLATNYDSEADKDDGSCIIPINGGITTLSCSMFEGTGVAYILEDKGLAVDYRVTCKMAIYGDLTIMPGVCIEFESNAGLEVNESGSIKAVATTEGPIKFTGVEKERGAWAGIYIDANDIKNKLDGVTLEYAGGAAFNSNGDKGAIILYAGTKAQVQNCYISNSSTFGITSTYGDCELVLNNNTITSCSKPIYTSANYVGSIEGGNYTGNDVDVIYIKSYGSAGRITQPAIWNKLSVPYQVETGNLIEIISTNLTILPGAIIKFESGTGITVQDNSSLKAVGTLDNPIKFTGVDGLPGSWGNITFNFTQSALNEIGHAIIEHSGNSEAKGAISMWANPKVNVHDVIFRQIATCAFYDAPKSNPASQEVNPNLNTNNNLFESIGNQYNEDTDPGNSSYCFGG